MERDREVVPFPASAPSVPERTRPMEAVQEENAFNFFPTLALPQGAVLLPMPAALSALDAIKSNDSSSEPKDPKPSEFPLKSVSYVTFALCRQDKSSTR